MGLRLMVSRALACGLAGLLLSVGSVQAAEIKVMISGGLSAAYRALTPEFEQSSGHRLVTAWGPSMGSTHDAIPVRLQRGEKADVLIMVGPALEELIRQGKVIAGSRVDLVRSPIGMVVRAGAAKPDIGSVDAFKQALLAAKTVAYSDSASGVYIGTELFQRLGIVEQMQGKRRMIPAEPVAGVVARGEAEIGFQQTSELLPVPGVDLVGPLPPELQKITVFSAGIVAGTQEPEAAKALIAFLASPAAAPALRKSGLEPIAADAK
jgi:molybdate transport system substrate-binding protein